MYRAPAKFAARYPGRCLCGASFSAGAAIYWDGSVRRATGCPSCAPRKATPGVPFVLPSGICVRFDRHPDTGAVVLCAITDPSAGFGALEVYRLVDGEWSISQCGREMVFTGVLPHAQIEGWRAQAEAASLAA